MARILFPEGKQKELIEKILQEKKATINEIAKICGTSERTVRDWRREKFTISEKAFLQISKKYNLLIPSRIKKLDDYWYAIKSYKKAALKRVELYGSPGTPEGRKKGGKNSQLRRKLYPHLYTNCILRKNFLEPKKSIELAEIVGIILGDGGITDYQLKITLNKETESEYISFVTTLLEKIFREKPCKYFFNNKRGQKVCNITINGINLIRILQNLGLKKGNKITHQVKVPDWIIKNKKYSKSCLRGLIDTDGGLYFHKHKTCGYDCFNLGLAYTSYSKPLLKFAHDTLVKFGFSSKLKEKCLFLYRYEEIVKYFDIIGSSNNHHTQRLKEFIKLKKRRSTQVAEGARLESV